MQCIRWNHRDYNTKDILLHISYIFIAYLFSYIFYSMCFGSMKMCAKFWCKPQSIGRVKRLVIWMEERRCSVIGPRHIKDAAAGFLTSSLNKTKWPSFIFPTANRLPLFATRADLLSFVRGREILPFFVLLFKWCALCPSDWGSNGQNWLEMTLI